MMLAILFAALQQVLPPQPAPEQRTVLDLAMAAHLAVAQSERELEFFDRYEKAGDEARARARLVLERLRSPGAPGGSPSSIFAVAKATRALDLAAADATKRDVERLQELVDALDLEPSPGMFAAGASTEGQVVRVVVYPLYPPPERLQVTLSLWWTHPDGREQLGYRGLAKPAVFEPQGFCVDAAAPGTEAGAWKLAIELEREGLVVRAAPLEIQCVPRLAERTRALFDKLEDLKDPRQALARWIALASQRGMRTLARTRVEDQFERLESHPREGVAYPWSLAFVAEGGEQQWLWRVDGPGDPQATLLLLCPSSQPPEATLSRDGWAWPGYRVLSTHVPRGSGGEGSVKELFDRVRAALALESHGTQPIFVVARGDAIGRLAMGFYGANSRPYDAEILSMSTAPLSADSLESGVPRIVFAPGGSAKLAAMKPGSKTWWLDAPTIPLIADFELPRRLRESIHVLTPAQGETDQEKK